MTTCYFHPVAAAGPLPSAFAFVSFHAGAGPARSNVRNDSSTVTTPDTAKMNNLLAVVDHLPRGVLNFSTLLATLILGVLDYLTGHEISFAVFYLLPVAVAAWALGTRWGAAYSLLSALTWHLSNALSGQVFSHALVPYWNSATRLGFFLVVTALLSRLRKVVDEQRALARTDFLTGALNSRAFREAAKIEMERARRYERPLTVAYIDLDNFKTVNDTLGHSSGDALLRGIATVMRRQMRLSDTVGRLGGDEFCLLLPESDAPAAKQIIARLQAGLLAEMERGSWPVTFSIGVLTCLAVPHSADEMVRLADELMYRAKKGGKNAIVSSVHAP